MYYAFSTATEKEFQCEYMTDVFCITHVHGYFELIFVMEVKSIYKQKMQIYL